jgi:hypothetical protein
MAKEKTFTEQEVKAELDKQIKARTGAALNEINEVLAKHRVRLVSKPQSGFIPGPNGTFQLVFGAITQIVPAPEEEKK